TFASWGDSPTTLATLQSLEGAVRSLLNEQRSGAGKLRDAIDKVRLVKRDALVQFLLAYPQDNRPWATAKDLSDYLLTDVEMEPCATTSRIRFAIAAAQRLVTQTIAQSEQLQLTSDQADEWQSISQYRLWEVRERILLYPENWLRF